MPTPFSTTRQPIKRRIQDSDALFANATARRVRQPVLLTGVKIASVVTLIPVEDFGRISIDREDYQRDRIGETVNTLTTILKSGGQIPDPVDIAERPDGSWWIVDGQQRFLAHEAAAVPLKAHVHKIADRDSERKLFMILNSSRRVLPRTLIKGWPGPFGDFIRNLNTSDKSALRGMIDLTNNSKLPFDAATILKAVIVVLTGTTATGDTATALLPRADTALKMPHARVWAEAFVQLMAAVFATQGNGGRVRVLPVVALAHVAHRKYKEAGRPIFPRTTTRLRNVNWDTAVPTHAQQYQDILEKKIEKLWK